ncbi:MAG: hypothetical protein QHC79_15285 [Pseudosphingobacterium sp.]|nr:hypothetical protein [Pseudosphingobacterium sp.]
MKSILLVLFLTVHSGCNGSKHAIANTSTTVYLCGSGKGKKYHLNANCRGLSNCNYKTVKTTLEKAKKEGKTLCGWED